MRRGKFTGRPSTTPRVRAIVQSTGYVGAIYRRLCRSLHHTNPWFSHWGTSTQIESWMGCRRLRFQHASRRCAAISSASLLRPAYGAGACWPSTVFEARRAAATEVQSAASHAAPMLRTGRQWRDRRESGPETAGKPSVHEREPLGFNARAAHMPVGVREIHDNVS